jgi:hypothetical protein
VHLLTLGQELHHLPDWDVIQVAPVHEVVGAGLGEKGGRISEEGGIVGRDSEEGGIVRREG